MEWKIIISFDEYISNRCDIERRLKEMKEKYKAILLEKVEGEYLHIKE